MILRDINRRFGILVIFYIFYQVSAQNFRRMPQLETGVYLLDSYIPAAMQVIAHLSESLKYDLKPPSVPSTTLGPPSGKPTSTHKPGIYAPSKPLGPENYEKLTIDNDEFDKTIDSRLVHIYDDIDSLESIDDSRIARVETALHVENEELPENLENLIGDTPAQLIKLINSQDLPLTAVESKEQVKIFSQNYDDSDFRIYLEKAKRTPPTKAYVNLLSLYDSLSKESKKQGFNKYQGYHHHVVVELVKTSSGTSTDQLKFVLDKILVNQDTKSPDVKKKIENLLEDLKKEGSYMQKALSSIPPLQFSI